MSKFRREIPNPKIGSYKNRIPNFNRHEAFGIWNLEF
jgi:hypothetical protein